MTDGVETLEGNEYIQKDVITYIAPEGKRGIAEKQKVLKCQETVGLTKSGMENVLKHWTSKAM